MDVNEPEKAREGVVVDVDMADDGGVKGTPTTKTALDVVEVAANANGDAANFTTNTQQVSANNIDGTSGKGTLDLPRDIVKDAKEKEMSLGSTEESPMDNVRSSIEIHWEPSSPSSLLRQGETEQKLLCLSQIPQRQTK